MTITSQQVKHYMKNRKQGSTQSKSAMSANIGERTARKLDHGQHCSQQPAKPRDYKTRTTPFDEVWEKDLKPLLIRQPTLTAAGLYDHMDALHGEECASYLRTLQRHVKAWKLTEGAEKEVMFLQKHPPGQQAQVDFTEFNTKNDKVLIRLAGRIQPFRLLHVKFTHSSWTYAHVVLGAESFSALATGVAAAFERFGGVPYELRTDSLSAAYKNLSPREADDLTRLFKAFCETYCITPTRNNRGLAHENGAVESGDGHNKKALANHLKCLYPDVTDGVYDFESLEAFQAVINKMMDRQNRRRARRVELDRQHTQPLPTRKAVNYTVDKVSVTSSSTIKVKRVLYSVPSRLIGSRLTVRVYDDRLELYAGIQQVYTLARVHARGNEHLRVIDYRHLIHSLVKKPMAFYRAELRDEILPNVQWRLIWQDMMARLPAKDACYLIVDALSLASQLNDEDQVAQALRQILVTCPIPSTVDLRQQLNIPLSEKMPKAFAQIVTQHPLAQYDQFIGGMIHA